MNRCVWARSPLNVAYHDSEWGVPLHDEHMLFEFLVLEGTQAGLSWTTILKKRQHYREVFGSFDPVKVAAYGEKEVKALLADPGIVRNRLKVAAAINNSRRFLDVQAEFGSFDVYLWRFVDGKPIANTWRYWSEVPVTTPISALLSNDLGRRGFKFVGSTICYAFMQAVGMVNDHTIDCFRHAEISAPSHD